MSTLDATVSMLEAMPEDARIKVMEFTQKLFTSRKPANPFVPVSQEQILSDLAESRQQISDGKGLDMEDALKKHAWVHCIKMIILHFVFVYLCLWLYKNPYFQYFSPLFPFIFVCHGSLD